MGGGMHPQRINLYNPHGGPIITVQQQREEHKTNVIHFYNQRAGC